MRILQLFLMFAVICCGVHVEPLQAHSQVAFHASEAEHHEAGDDQREGDEGAAEAAHAVHHHCPIAPDRRELVQGATQVSAGLQLYPRRTEVLGSLGQAPPLEPPAA
jgi:hypothetical protein